MKTRLLLLFIVGVFIFSCESMKQTTQKINWLESELNKVLN